MLQAGSGEQLLALLTLALADYEDGVPVDGLR